MAHIPSMGVIEALRKRIPPGTRIELVQTDDPYSKLKPSDQGTVTHIDDMGTVFCKWDSGSILGLVYGEDSYRIVK